MAKDKWEIPLFNRFIMAIPELTFDDDFMKAGVAMGAITEEQRQFLKQTYARTRKASSTVKKLSHKSLLGKIMFLMPEILSVPTIDFMRRHKMLGENVATYNGLRFAFSAAKQLRPIFASETTMMARISAVYGAATSNYLVNFLRDLDDAEIAAQRRRFLIEAGKDPDTQRLSSAQAAAIRAKLLESVLKAQRFRSAFSTIDIIKNTAIEARAQRNAWSAVAVIVDGVFSDQMIKNAIRSKVIPADMVNLIWKLDQLGIDTGKYGQKVFEQALRKGPKVPGDLDTDLVNVFGAGRDLFLSVWRRAGKSFEYESWAARSLLISEGVISPEMINFLAKTGVISPQVARLMYPAATAIRAMMRSELGNYLIDRRYRIVAGESPIATFAKHSTKTDRAILSLLQQAAADAQKDAAALAAKGGVGNLTRASQQRIAAASLHTKMRELWENVGHLTIYGEKEAARMALDSQDFLAKNLYGAAAGTRHDALVKSMQDAARSNVDAYISREENTLQLSARIWRQTELSTGMLQREIQKGLLRGLSAEELAGKVGGMLKPGVAGGISYNAMRLARTEINNAFHFTQIRYTREMPWVDGYQWHKSRSHAHVDVCDDRASRNHDGLGRGIYKKRNVPGKAHPHCFPAGTMVSVSDVENVTRRWYDGAMIKVILEGEVPVELSGTPNHPALTQRGWVGLGDLREGDYVITDRSSDGVFEQMPDDQQMVARIEDLFDTARVTSSSPAVSMPVAAEDFHGDGTDGEVNIVGADGLLRDGVGGQELSGVLFDGAALADDLIGRGDSAAVLDGLPGSTDSVVSGSDHSSAFLLALQSEGGVLTPELDASVLQSVPDGADTEANDFGRLIKRLAGKVNVRRVLNVSSSEFSGHVYNLQTKSGWYTANKVIVHNCFCYLTTVTAAPGRFEQQLRRGSYDRYLKQAEKSPIDSAYSKASTVGAAALPYAKAVAKSSSAIAGLYLGSEMLELLQAARLGAAAADVEDL